MIMRCILGARWVTARAASIETIALSSGKNLLKFLSLVAAAVLLLTLATVSRADWISQLVRFERDFEAARDPAIGGNDAQDDFREPGGIDFGLFTRLLRGKRALARLRQPIGDDGLMPALFLAEFAARDLSPVIEPPAQLELARFTTVEPGDTFAGILNAQGLARADIFAINESVNDVFELRKLGAGWPISFRLDATIEPSAPGRLISLHFSDTPNSTVSVQRTVEGYTATRDQTVLTTQLMVAEGTVESTFWVNAKALSLPYRVISMTEQALQCEMDFNRDIGAGDNFRILFDAEINDDGKIINAKAIHYASFDIRKGRREVFRYTTNGDASFFNRKGRRSCGSGLSLLRQPLERPFRMSSPFNPKRKHPITGKIRPHRGVDFAAPRGTRILAAGDGVVIAKRTHSGGYGKHVIIRHSGGTYETLYAHMSRFPSSLRVGSQVRQGDVIGYVGTTGASTGNHLHYEIRKNGRHIDPLRSSLPKGQQLTGSALQAFEGALRAIIDRLDEAQPLTSAVTAPVNGSEGG